MPSASVTSIGRTDPPTAYITSRPRDSSVWFGPGPGRYNPEKSMARSAAPSYSIGQKHKHLEKLVHTVGPNQYGIKNSIGGSNFKSTLRTAPAVSMSCKHSCLMAFILHTYFNCIKLFS